jgi:competence ComEA-like helix-hairpin-helix protein
MRPVFIHKDTLRHGLPLTGPEKKVLGFTLLLSLLGAGVLALKACWTPQNPLWVQTGAPEAPKGKPVQAYPAYAPKSNLAPGSVDLNRATAGELRKVPSVGVVLAGRILDYRREKGSFRSVSQLREVSGIGEKRFRQIAPYFSVRTKPLATDEH